MFEIYRNDISITRGDSAIFEVTITDKDGNAYTPTHLDKVTFTVKKDTNSNVIVFQRPVENGKVIIEPEDTKNLRYGDYVYDVQLVTAGGWVATVIPPHLFTVSGEVTF